MADAGSIVVFLCFFIVGSLNATKVHITQRWEPNHGWNLVCDWTLLSNDSLQSVMLSWNKQQFFIGRPKNSDATPWYGQGTYYPERAKLTVDCISGVETRVKGRCQMIVEPLVAPEKDFVFGCAVSGERPHFIFKEEEKVIEALVPPSETIMVVTKPESGRATINCSTTGIPRPRIVWTVDNQTVPHTFQASSWNSTSKLWDVWSTFTPTTAGVIKCTPKVVKGTRQIMGQSAQYNNTFRILLDRAIIALAVFSALLLS